MRGLTILLLLAALLFTGPANAENWTKENFEVVQIDLSGTTWYIGKQTQEGGWYIQALDTSMARQFRVTYSYIDGNADFSHHWTNRATLSGVSSYKTYEEAF